MSCSCCSAGAAKGFNPFIAADKLDHRCRLDNARSKFKSQMARPEKQESSLQKLPIEVYHNVLQYLDVGTLTLMRSVSQYTRSSIDTLHPYKELYDFAPQALRACLLTGLAPHIPLLRLHNALTTLECHYCKHTETPETTFGTYLSLWEGYRICAFCARNSPYLKPHELNQLLNISSLKKNKLQASSLSTIPKLKILPGTYSTAEVHAPHRTMLLLTNQITPGQPLSDKAARSLYTIPDQNAIYHHPFVREEDECDLSPIIGFSSPETNRLVSFRYATAMSFPFLNNSTKKTSHGILCRECCLRMRFTERMWKAEQRHRRQTGRSPLISNARRRLINDLRREASKYYIVAHEPYASDSGGGNGKKRKAGEGEEMSIQAHYREVHNRKVWEITLQEEAWRSRHVGPALPLLRNQDFWQPPPPRAKKLKVSEESEKSVEVSVQAVSN